MNKYLQYFFLGIIFFLSSVGSALAAEVSFTVPEQVSVGEVFEVLVNVDSEGVSINSVDFALKFNQDLITFSGYKSNNGVVGLWVKSPTLDDGVLSMSGIIPGGVSGLYDPKEKGLRAIPIVSLMFTAKKTGPLEFSFLDSKVLKHDGKGNELEHQRLSAKMMIVNNEDLAEDMTPDVNKIDKEKPEPFEIVFLDSAFFGRTPPMIIFETTDKISGVKEFRMKGVGDSWSVIKSPYPIAKGFFPRDVTIRAYDFYDNFEESSIIVPGMVGSRFFWGFILFILFCIGVYKVLKYKA